MRRISLLALAVILLAFTSTQVLTRNDIYNGIGTTYAWSGSAQSWSGSKQNLTCSDWTTYVRNDGTACTPSTLNVTYGYASAHAVVSVTHSPLLANNTFSGGSFSSWSSANTSACNGTVFAGQNSTDEDGDVGLTSASSLTCFSTAAVITLTQTFTVSGASPASQTYSLWYKAPSTTAGNQQCTTTNGTASFTIKIGSTVVATITPTMDNAWHQVTGSMTALVNGSNTLTITATLTAAQGQNYSIRTQACAGNIYSAQPLYLDNISLSAVW